MEAWALGMLSEESRWDWKVWMESLWRRRKLDWVDLAEAQGVEGSVRASLVFGVRGRRTAERDALTGVDADMMNTALLLPMPIEMTVSMLRIVNALFDRRRKRTLSVD